ncbi:hypothetical protein [Aeoliella mucimassa]|uniref:Nickel uptake substrate-specific transmembrane region n=1 Tax=Aeoliella mucimassa TaxID=2527972 RepID=A0A518AS59_9BACT|nr:hypothetical protein [Aeoliella mucimassa]QDU57563.1 hypothetical protein Pan181_37810 [Aeoliella mucimassa]
MLTLVAALGGCSDNPMASVSGQVKYASGEPITGGVRMVRFEPTDDSPAEIRKPATGEIKDDGTFEMFTLRPGDGVFKGKYKVVFTVMTSPMGGEWLIAPEYRHAESTPYEIVVDGRQTELEYEIKKLASQ